MNQKHLSATFALGLWAIATCGCGKSYPPVSGQVTSDGKPVAGVNILFVPVSTKENPFPGPFAEPTTDGQGNFSMTTRYGNKGATPGPNYVEFYSSGSLESEFLGSDVAKLQMKAGGEAASADNNSDSASKGKLDPDYKVEFTVPENGTDAANFELTKLKKIGD